MEPSRPLLTVDHLSVSFDDQHVLNDISFTLKRGETIAIVGPNGAGKTVLFRALLGLIPSHGTIRFARGTRIGYVPQRLSIERDLPLTVEEFLRLRENDEGEILKALRDVATPPGIQIDTRPSTHPTHGLRSPLLKRGLGVLSRGQFQRVLIAWALLGNPNILFFDEPTAGLDVGSEETIYELLHRLQRDRELAILLISHDLTIVYRYAQQVLCLNQSALCFGPPQDVLDPKTLRELYGHDTGFYAHGRATGVEARNPPPRKTRRASPLRGGKSETNSNT